MDQQTDTCKAIQRDVSVGRTWLLQMGRAARHHGITIQYCMDYPRHALQSLEIPVVTHVSWPNASRKAHSSDALTLDVSTVGASERRLPRQLESVAHRSDVTVRGVDRDRALQRLSVDEQQV